MAWLPRATRGRCSRPGAGARRRRRCRAPAAPAGAARPRAVRARAQRDPARPARAGRRLRLGGSFEAKNEYLPGLRRARPTAAHVYLDRFAELVPSLPINVGGHPPGAVLLLRWTLGIDYGAAAWRRCASPPSAVTAPLTYCARARRSASDATARGWPACSPRCSPGLLLFGMSSVRRDPRRAGTGRRAAARCRAPAAAGMRRASPPARSSAGRCWRSASSAPSWSGGARACGRRWSSPPAAAPPCSPSTAILALGHGLRRRSARCWPRTSTTAQSLARIRPYAFWWIGSPGRVGAEMGVPIAGVWLRRHRAAATPPPSPSPR